MTLIDGKAHAELIYQNLETVIEHELPVIGRPPRLVIITSDTDSASKVYVRNKTRACERLGIVWEQRLLCPDTTYQQMEEGMKQINAYNRIDGCIIQLPNPYADADFMLGLLDPKKDVDGLTLYNQGGLSAGRAWHEPCTPAGIVHMLIREGVQLSGKCVAIIGRSRLVGAPLAQMLTRYDATCTLCHSRTRNLAMITREADIVVAALGRPGFVTGDMIKPGTVVIDVGINRVDGKLVGDCAEDVRAKASLLTPVPGGVGPMTVAMLMCNTVQAWRYNNGCAL